MPYLPTSDAIDWVNRSIAALAEAYTATPLPNRKPKMLETFITHPFLLIIMLFNTMCVNLIGAVKLDIVCESISSNSVSKRFFYSRTSTIH